MISDSLIDCRQRSNGATTPAGEKRIRRFIESREIELKNVAKQIEDEEAQRTTCDNAIYNIELAILNAKKLLKAHEKNLSPFKTLRDRMIDVFSSLSWETKSEETSEVLCGKLRECFDMPATNEDEIIQGLMESKTTKIQRLCENIEELEIDLVTWRLSFRLSQSGLDRLKATRNTIEEDIKLAKSGFRAFWKIPTDVWVPIFDCVRRDELDDYLERRDFSTLRPMVHVLSHVCYYWRRIVDTEPSLWTTVYAPTTKAWKYHEYDILISSSQRSNKPLTLICNLYQRFRPDDQYHATQRLEKDDSIAPILMPDDQTVGRLK
jgi:hypothetical protein